MKALNAKQTKHHFKNGMSFENSFPGGGGIWEFRKRIRGLISRIKRRQKQTKTEVPGFGICDPDDPGLCSRIIH